MKKRYWFLISIPILIVVILVSIYASQFMVSMDTEGRVSISSYVVLAATERQSPDAIIAQTNLSGVIGDIQDDPDSPDANWWTTGDVGSDTVAHVSFSTPTGNPTVGADLQEFKIWVRKAGTNTPQCQIDLYEGGVVVVQGTLTDVTSTGGQLKTFTWNANLLSNADGSGVEIYIYSKNSGGKPADRGTVEVGAVEWNVDYSSATPNISNTPTSINFGTVKVGTSHWSNGSAPTFPLDDGECYFTVTNNSGAAADITIEADNFTGGVGWVISSSAGENTAVLKAGQSGDTVEGDMETLTGSPQAFIASLADTASKKWELKLEAPTSFTDGVEKTTTVTLTASLS